MVIFPQSFPVRQTVPSITGGVGSIGAGPVGSSTLPVIGGPSQVSFNNGNNGASQMLHAYAVNPTIGDGLRLGDVGNGLLGLLISTGVSFTFGEDLKKDGVIGIGEGLGSLFEVSYRGGLLGFGRSRMAIRSLGESFVLSHEVEGERGIKRERTNIGTDWVDLVPKGAIELLGRRIPFSLTEPTIEEERGSDAYLCLVQCGSGGDVTIPIVFREDHGRKQPVVISSSSIPYHRGAGYVALLEPTQNALAIMFESGDNFGVELFERHSVGFVRTGQHQNLGFGSSIDIEGRTYLILPFDREKRKAVDLGELTMRGEEQLSFSLVSEAQGQHDPVAPPLFHSLLAPPSVLAPKSSNNHLGDIKKEK